MKDELARFALTRFRELGFAGRGGTLRQVGTDLQWVVQVEKIGHVDQVNVELGVVFATDPPARRTDCTVLWSLANFPGVESDDVARAFLPVSDATLEEREQVIGPAIDEAAEGVRSWLDVAALRSAYAEGRLAKAFVLKDARALLEER